MMRPTQPKQNDGGAVLFLALGYLAALTILSVAFYSGVHHRVSRQFDDEARTEAFYIAEAGIQLSIAALTADRDFTGQPPRTFADGRLVTTVLNSGAPGTYEIIATGWPSTTPRDDRYVQLKAFVRLESATPRLVSMERVRRSDIDPGVFPFNTTTELK